MSVLSPWDSSFDRNHRADASAATGALSAFPQESKISGLTYEPFYRLTEKPFSLTSDARFFYHSRAHSPAFDDLLAAIRRRESLNVLSGDIGTGKTTLCRAVLENLDRKTFSAFVPDPFASREDLLKVLLVDFGVASVEDLASGRLRGASRTELSYLLYEFLGTLAPLQAFAVVFIDEAQNLSVPLLEEIRILSDADGQLQVVLVGQLELRQKLKLPEMRQVDQRISVHCNLAPLDGDAVAGYIDHRLQVAGGSPDRVRFELEAAQAVYRASGGVPRLINRICDRALHQAYLKRVCSIDRSIVEACTSESASPAVAVPAAISAVPAAEATPEPPRPEPPSDPVDIWLSSVDTATPTAPTVTIDPPPVATVSVTNPDQPAVAEATTSTENEPPPIFRPSFDSRTRVQRTHMERFTRRWMRRLATASIVFTVGIVVLIGAPSVLTLSIDLWDRSADLFEPPSAPVLPASPPSHQPVAVRFPTSIESLGPDVATVTPEASLVPSALRVVPRPVPSAR